MEPLESRIAPASLTFTDSNGDNVTIKTSGPGTLTLGVNVLIENGVLRLLDLKDPAFQNSKVSIIALPDPVNGGDGLVNVGRIDATGRDLTSVFVDGDLGSFRGGDEITATRALKSFTVQSLGVYGLSTGSPDFFSAFLGRVDRLTVQSDVRNAAISVGDGTGTNGKIGRLVIGGSIVGGPENRAGTVFAQDGIDSLKVG